MTAAWKASVRARLNEIGQSEAWLARQVSERRHKTIKPDSINKMLKSRTGSIFVEDVCAILGLPPPTIDSPDEKTTKIIELAMRAPDEVKDAVLVLLGGTSPSVGKSK